MGRTNKKRKADIIDWTETQYYYPIYRGWVLDTPYIFKNPCAALCFKLSRYRKDLLSYSYDVTPDWLYCVVHLHKEHEDDVTLTTFESKSSIESNYFSETKFYQLQTDSKVKSMLVRVNMTPLTNCLGTFRSSPDYMSSSASIYRQNFKCYQEYDYGTLLSKFDFKEIPQKRDERNYISIGHNAKKILRSACVDTYDGLLESIKHKLSINEGREVILSLGCGNGVTELLSSKLCICLDVDRRAIFSGMIQMHKSKDINCKTTIYGVFDYSTSLLNLCKDINRLCGKTKCVRVLFQHPTPSCNESIRSKLAMAISQVRTALISSYVNDIVFVYDTDSQRNTWSEEYLLELIFNGIERENKTKIMYETQPIVNYDEDLVSHPIFDVIKKYGWAKMRNCDQASLVITYQH